MLPFSNYNVPIYNILQKFAAHLKPCDGTPVADTDVDYAFCMVSTLLSYVPQIHALQKFAFILRSFGNLHHVALLFPTSEVPAVAIFGLGLLIVVVYKVRGWVNLQ
jgi:hypothetical protein